MSEQSPEQTPSTLAEAAAQADALAIQGSERELAQLRTQWDDELEAAARSEDFRQRALAFKAIGQFRFRQKLELLKRGFDDDSPACRGSALISLELLSRDHPGAVNAVRSNLHVIASRDGNNAVRRLAILCLRNGSPQPDTLGLLAGMAEDEAQDEQVRSAARSVVGGLKRKAGARINPR
jgi:HEAT repeat protein